MTWENILKVTPQEEAERYAPEIVEEARQEYEQTKRENLSKSQNDVLNYLKKVKIIQGNDDIGSGERGQIIKKGNQELIDILGYRDEFFTLISEQEIKDIEEEQREAMSDFKQPVRLRDQYDGSIVVIDYGSDPLRRTRAIQDYNALTWKFAQVILDNLVSQNLVKKFFVRGFQPFGNEPYVSATMIWTAEPEINSWEDYVKLYGNPAWDRWGDRTASRKPLSEIEREKKEKEEKEAEQKRKQNLHSWKKTLAVERGKRERAKKIGIKREPKFTRLEQRIKEEDE